jgi:hypothetical protein
MYGVSLLRQADLAGAQRDRNTVSALWQTRSFVAGPGVRHCLKRASGTGACAVSWRQLRDEHPDTPGHDRVSGPFTNNERETSCSRTREIAEVSKNTVGSKRRERLIREEITGDYEDPDRTAREEFEDLLAVDEEYEWQVDDEECDGVDGFDADLGE